MCVSVGGGGCGAREPRHTAGEVDVDARAVDVITRGPGVGVKKMLITAVVTTIWVTKQGADGIVDVDNAGSVRTVVGCGKAQTKIETETRAREIP